MFGSRHVSGATITKVALFNIQAAEMKQLESILIKDQVYLKLNEDV